MALDYDIANNEWVEFPANSPALNGVTGATLMFWAHPETINGAQFCAFLSTGTATFAPRVAILTDTGPSVWAVIARRLDGDATLGLNSVIAPTTVLTHVAGVCRYDAQLLELYLDGQLNNSFAVASWTGSTSATDSLGASIGARPGGSLSYDGRLSDARVYARALQAVEIRNIFLARGRDRSFFGLVNRWKSIEQNPGAQASSASVVKDTAILDAQGTSGLPAPDVPEYTEYLVGGTRHRRR